jgi:hypothetical protein
MDISFRLSERPGPLHNSRPTNGSSLLKGNENKALPKGNMGKTIPELDQLRHNPVGQRQSVAGEQEVILTDRYQTLAKQT